MPKGDAAPALFTEGELPPKAPSLAQAGFDLWQEFARRNKWQVATDCGPTYQAALKRAIPEYGGLQRMRTVLEMLERSDFYMGRVPPTGKYTKPFRARLVWFLRPSTVLELKEQLYNGGLDPVTIAPEKGRIQPTAINWRAVLDGYKGKGRSFWHHSFGPCPEEPGPHKIPADLLGAWRERQGLTGIGHNGPHTETREERLASSIASYRRVGQYDRANVLEQQLADLEKRPPVLVPAPEAASFGMPPKPGATNGRGPVGAKSGHPQRPAVDVTDLSPPPWEGEGEPVGDYEVEADD